MNTSVNHKPDQRIDHHQYNKYKPILRTTRGTLKQRI